MDYRMPLYIQLQDSIIKKIDEKKYRINVAFILRRFFGCTKLGTSFQRKESERMEETERQSRV